jgi:hypothetical protein
MQDLNKLPFRGEVVQDLESLIEDDSQQISSSVLIGFANQRQLLSSQVKGEHEQTSKLVDPASDHILRLKIKPCTCKNTSFYVVCVWLIKRFLT